MNNAMIYKNYTARIEFDPRDNILVGRVLGVRDIIGFHGETVAELTADFHAAIDHYIEACKREQPRSKDLVEAQAGSMNEIWDNEADEAWWTASELTVDKAVTNEPLPGLEAS